ncbi:hypothetical protein, partial [Acinetobacter baumannii]|uniref:hypothetical protein n=1 Tax=Acinetobacter baumannii TaxID=470 RepID=UPI0037DBF14F
MEHSGALNWSQPALSGLPVCRLLRRRACPPSPPFVGGGNSFLLGISSSIVEPLYSVAGPILI